MSAIVTSIIGSGGLIVAMLGVMIRSMNRQFTQTNQRIDEVRTDLNTRLEETNRHLERVETRVDQIGRDIGELRDRTGKLGAVGSSMPPALTTSLQVGSEQHRDVTHSNPQHDGNIVR